eukprot:UN06203
MIFSAGMCCLLKPIANFAFPVRKLPEANDKTARDFKKIDEKIDFFRFFSNYSRRFLVMSKWFLSALRPSKQPPKLLYTSWDHLEKIFQIDD